MRTQPRHRTASLRARRLWALPALGVALWAAPAPAQTAGPDTVLVPVPVEGGVLYYRAGAPGGVRIRSRRAAPRPAAVPAPAARTLGAAVPAGDAAATAEDILALEERLLRALDARLGELARGLPARAAAPSIVAGGAAPPTVVVVPGQQGGGEVIVREPALPPAVTPPVAPAVPPPAPPPAAPSLPIVVTPVPPLQPAPRVPVAPIETPARPAEPDTVAAPGGVTAEEVERRILETGLFRTSTVHFATARADLLDASLAVLDVIGEVVARHPALRLAIDGHTDSVGSDAVNDPLSLRRAESVRAYLLDRFPEIDPGRLVARGLGSRQPIASNATDVGRTLNRRVEFVVLGVDDE